MNYIFEKLAIPDVLLITQKTFKDERGIFIEAYNEVEFEKRGIKTSFVLEGISRSKHGVLRGLHYQTGNAAQAKLIRCSKGKVFDVAVDVRKDSPTFGKHVAITLSEDKAQMLWIPRGFAHGFLVLSPEAEVVYKMDNFHSPTHEAGVLWNDPSLDISWPAQPSIISEKDKKWPLLTDD
jgi:dTDP-4-dehydrorhamnose 3,5-epimerase